MFGGNVRYKQRRADEEPSNVPASQKVIFGGSFSPRKVHPDAKHNREVDPDDHEIQGGHTLMCDRDFRCKQHPFLLSIRRTTSAESVAQLILLSRERNARQPLVGTDTLSTGESLPPLD